MTVNVGALLDRFPGQKYQSALHFAELSFRAPRPRAGTLGKLKRDGRDSLKVSLVAPRDALLDDRGVMNVANLAPGIEWVRAAANALEAVAVVLPTGRELTPGMRDRARLEAYVDALGRTSGRAIVWAPAGLWERETAEAFAKKIGVVLAFDPLEDDAPEGPVGYARLRAIGARSRISSGMLAGAAVKLLEGGFATSYLAIDSPTSFRDAKSFQALVAGAMREDEAGDDDDFEFDDEE